MKVTTQERITGSKLKLGIEIPADESKEAYEKTVRELAQSANIPGFRRGKAPRHILVQRFGAQRLKAAALEDLLKETIEKAFEQEKVEVLGNFDIEPKFEELADRYEPGKTLEFAALADVPASAELGDYQNLSVRAEEIQATSEMVENYLERVRQERATLIPIEDRAAQLGDIAIVDYSGSVHGQEEGEEIALDGAKDTEIELDSNRYLAGMVEGIVGMKIGETKTISVEFPEEYTREDIAGKTGVLQIALKELKEKELPELDDDFAEEVSEDCETIAALREQLLQRFQENADNKTQSNIAEAIVAELVNVAQIDLSEAEIQREFEQVAAQKTMEFQQQGFNLRQLPEDLRRTFSEQFRREAIARLQQILALNAVAEKEGIAPGEEEIASKVAEVEAQLGDRQQIDRDRLREFVIEDLRREQAIAWLQERATVELVPEGTLSQEEEEEEAAASDATLEAEVVEASPEEEDAAATASSETLAAESASAGEGDEQPSATAETP